MTIDKIYHITYFVYHRTGTRLFRALCLPNGLCRKNMTKSKKENIEKLHQEHPEKYRDK